MRNLKIGIGILAYNEEDNIESTLISLFKQSIFADQKIASDTQLAEVEIIVVPNGCSDNTAAIATQVLTNRTKQWLDDSTSNFEVKGSVIEVESAGKSNAWNSYIHDFSGPELDVIVMIDADIEFNELETIKNSIETLLDNSEARIVVDTPLKSIHQKIQKSFLDRISLRISKEYLENSVGVAGSFYGSWASILREVWMPAGLPSEDGFLKAMIITDMFRSKPDESKIVRVNNASHYYVPETSISGILKHELRTIVGSSINCYLTWDFLLFSTDPKGPGAGLVLKNLIEKEPDWLQLFISNTVKNKGFWVLPRGTLSRGIRSLRGKSLLHDYKSFISVFFRLAVNFPIFLVANHKIKSGRAIGYW